VNAKTAKKLANSSHKSLFSLIRCMAHDGYTNMTIWADEVSSKEITELRKKGYRVIRNTATEPELDTVSATITVSWA
jgi:hypothetical protein